MAASRLLVPVSESSTVRQTVDYAVGTALEGGDGYLRFVYLHAPDQTREAFGAEYRVEAEDAIAAAGEFLDRVEIWAEEDAGESEGELTVETAQLGTDRYLFGPEDVARAIIDDAEANDVGHVVLDPEYDPGIGAPLLRPLRLEITRYSDLQVEEATVQRPIRRRPLVVGSTPLQVGVLFGISFLFYQALAGSFETLDLVTGAISATIVAVGLSRITFARDPSLVSVARLLRMGLYIPYLLYEILKANVAVTAVILHPRMPIDPRLTRVQTAVWGSLPVTTLANSITLTPGTLSVRVTGRTIIVHTLIPSAREDLFDGGLERGVRFVFYGRAAMQLSSPRERDDAELLDPPPDATGESSDEKSTDDTDGGAES